MVQTLQKKIGPRFSDTLFIIIGTLFVAFGFNAFLLPNRIVSGGINGLTIILYETLHLTPSIVLFSVNFILLALSFFLLGKEVFFKSILGSFLVPLFVSLLHGVALNNIEPILAAIFGGVTVGLGVGLVFLGKGSTGGTALIALIVQKYIPIKLGIILGICDGLVILSALFVFDVQTVLFALIALYLTSRMVDTVQVGPESSKNVMIISNDYKRIREQIISDLDLGATLIPIEGGLNLETKKMVMVVIQEDQFITLRQAILNIDEEAFVVVTSAHEVVGKGFTAYR
ncbi:YitT family protein [Vagococcus sp. JNUCC 83]